MTREEIARVIAQSKSAALSEAIDAFQELARETEAFSDLQPVTVYLKHVRAVADSQLSKLHQDAGSEPVSVGGGWVLVPREPTEKMKDAHYAAHATSGRVFASAEEVYRAMLAAAPAHGGGG